MGTQGIFFFRWVSIVKVNVFARAISLGVALFLSVSVNVCWAQGTVHSATFTPARVAFIEFRKPDGTLVVLEKGGRFSHLAISYQGQWLQAHPYGGVRLISLEDLRKTGFVAAIVTLKKVPEPSAELIQPYLGKAYDSGYSWSDEKMYCSELVAKILGIPPQPMVFDPELWPAQYVALNGQPGISPDGIFRILWPY